MVASCEVERWPGRHEMLFRPCLLANMNHAACQGHPLFLREFIYPLHGQDSCPLKIFRLDPVSKIDAKLIERLPPVP